MNIGIILLILILFYKNKGKTLSITPNEEQTTSSEFENDTLILDIDYTKEKIDLMKKIGVFFPEKLIIPINKAIFISEKTIKLYETMEFISTPKISYIEKSVPVENNKERLSYIINTIQREFPKENIQNIALMLDIIINIDKYKSMLSRLNALISNPNSLQDPDKLFQLLEPMMEGKDEKEKDKIKEIVKLLGVMKDNYKQSEK
ncbi:hypothetical protein EDD65_11158 [Keratinibaculum paraultunense]|uniref:Uncharacterized protein n=1 Tax=Keratinibaculum paraultunense TaxID=1278232 RepID=A0A4R3KUL8_9FIRM|nr:hypothetical protein [Keratinibaculum paraultunense]QQY78796.1 hypothetical protein JL105_06210 [Keratinibaculum paraultunense]TCS87495.1 hypothetical protein EDD65_11158 [Keratinibaculum paraultunense]